MSVSVIDATSTGSTGTLMVSGNMPTFSAYNTSSQSVSNSTNTKVLFQTKEWDTTSSFTSNTTYTPTVAGYYQLNANISFTGFSANAAYFQFYKNGSAYKVGNRMQTSGQYTFLTGSCLVYLNGSTDYVEVYAFQNSGSSQNIDYGPVNETYFQATLVRAA